MPRTIAKLDDVEAMTARRESIMAELATLDEQLKTAELAARDAGRPVLLGALERVKVAAMEKSDARAIATAIAHHGGKSVAAHLGSLTSA